jgi:zinc protease
MKRYLFGMFAGLGLILSICRPAGAAVDIREVRSPEGLTAWLVEDYANPIITLHFAFRGGGTQDPQGKEGLAKLMAALLDEGAGEWEATEFQNRLDIAGAEMRFSAGYDEIHGTMRLLSDEAGGNIGAAAELLGLALRAPRFDEGPFERVRAQMLARIAARVNDPETIAQRIWAEALYGEHPYARREEGSAETLLAIIPSDLEEMRRRVFAHSNLFIGVVGAIDEAELGPLLDTVFGDLPSNADLRPVADARPALDQVIRLDYAIPQARLRLAFPGVKREAPEFFAAYLMNHILGGGTFSSRLFDEVREKRGLAYGISSSLSNRSHATLLTIGTQTPAERMEETLDVIRTVIAGMVAEGPTEEELEAAKRYVIGAYVVDNLDTSMGIARTLVALQLEELGIDYIERREALIRDVSREEVHEAARQLLSVEPALMIMGPQDFRQ